MTMTNLQGNRFPGMGIARWNKHTCKEKLSLTWAVHIMGRFDWPRPSGSLRTIEKYTEYSEKYQLCFSTSRYCQEGHPAEKLYLSWTRRHFWAASMTIAMGSTAIYLNSIGKHCIFGLFSQVILVSGNISPGRIFVRDILHPDIIDRMVTPQKL